MRQRSSYPKPFKAQVVQECLKPGASVSSVAISHGINANVIRKWLPIYRDKPVALLPTFVPPGQPDEGAGARWRGHLAYREAFEPRQVSLAWASSRLGSRARR